MNPGQAILTGPSAGMAMVEVVFLLAVKMTSKFEIKRTKQFYKDFLQLTDNDENLEAVKKMDSALDIYQYFIK
ncbi:hypothetical protein [Enterocloster sp.]|uniref:hypothetical protein n=1 Tax=Enterocloster sp. TaxID=2719315 RepID=UPI0039A199FA